jgi:hypothetical protein
MNSSSSDHEHQDVKQQPLEGPNAPLDPNYEFDLRNGILKSGNITVYLTIFVRVRKERETI